ncbi:hypothetical protein HDU67_003439 [Dinochytrium kinnereticum]|nr:hypothetical protein HDU67_003439 [Dinochytrium kinnereticum]
MKAFSLILTVCVGLLAPLIESQPTSSPDCPSLVGRLQTAAEGSNFISETDAPWIPFLYQVGIPPVGFPVVRNFARISGMILVSDPTSSRSGAVATTEFIDKRIRPYPENEPLLKEMADIFGNFTAFGLEDFRLYRLYGSPVQADIFIVGKIRECGLLGIRTVSIET